MKILIDIGHPGHVHLFRPFAQQIIGKGHQVLFTCRQKEFEIELLEAAGFDYRCFGKHYSSKWGKIWGLVRFNLQLLVLALQFKPDLFLSHGSFYAAHVSFLLRKPHISFEDTGNMEQVRLYEPFTEVVLTPSCFKEKISKKQISYAAYHELAYLRPCYFQPLKEKIRSLGLVEGEKFALLRFVSWNATHDKGQGGFSEEQKMELVKQM